MEGKKRESPQTAAWMGKDYEFPDNLSNLTSIVPTRYQLSTNIQTGNYARKF